MISDEGICPKIFHLIMDWVQEHFLLKPNINPTKRFRKRETLMNALKNTYAEIAGGTIETQQIILDTSSCLVHQNSFLKSLYRLLNNKYLMNDAQWLPFDVQEQSQRTNTKENVYSEVASGRW